MNTVLVVVFFLGLFLNPTSNKAREALSSSCLKSQLGAGLQLLVGRLPRQRMTPADGGQVNLRIGSERDASRRAV